MALVSIVVNTWLPQNLVELRHQIGRTSLKNLGQVKI